MDKTIALEELQLHLDFFKKMYQVVRIVDPTTKKVLNYNDKSIEYTDGICYSYWENDSMCENCVSMRAFFSKDTVYKLEYLSDKVYMITAIPIRSTDGLVILELLKDVTHTMLIDTEDNEKAHNIKSYISNMNDMVVKDPLTGLYNRRFIDERLPVDIIQSLLNEKPLSIIMTDIDQFKAINDELGHIEGDSKIKQYGEILKSSIRLENDWVARYGGDEFLICLNNTDNDTAYSIAERIRKKIERDMSLNKHGNINITGSFGICTMYKEEMTAEDMMKTADNNLFIAKEKGKNIVIR
ncbi:diguanylate cyclase (GGDEF) domain-containing protein [Proteiniborus ethanoligenes]|uniref:Diguanylate cyclase (GGDEF) domain-containing protein n=1 Tax=Proteiniborus ethanoligenes TaxID=415015 RepID=A0A1H3QC71_9FIRM|nr:GGDEF domain-containing protein [Proteiniborus ethanoligenes]TAH63310.1 MAG: GGDEF domain-containing protein [Gottschalkiaceae bacterium]SDZ10721.1 diguanylate cyclase (GGDEF) domain-containing protein [Proteiniborus ethanoligenes]